MKRLGKIARSDMTIKCHGRVYHANRNVESITGTIELPDDNPDILEYFLEFLYTGDYTDGVTKCNHCIRRAGKLKEALKDWFLAPDDISSWDSPENDEAKGTDNRGIGKDMTDLTTWCEEDFDKNLEEYLALPKTHRSHPCVNMTLPLRLYVMAVKYDVKPLAHLARKRFITALANYEWKYMPQVVDELYQNTLSTAYRWIRQEVIQALVDKMYKR